VVAETVIVPPRPYSLARSAAGPPCPTRRWRGGVLRVALDAPGGPGQGAAAQRADGALLVRVEAPDADAAMALMRRVLALDAGVGALTAAWGDDPLLGPALRRLRGYRPLPMLSPAHALLRGVCGQLVRGRDARRAEAAALRAVGRRVGDLAVPISPAELRRVTVPVLQSGGLARRRAEALVRAARAVDLAALEGLPTHRVVERLCAQPGVGPWTAGVVCTEGLGRPDHGLVGDLGLIRLATVRLGRLATPEDTAELLDRYAPHQALAGAYLLAAAPEARLPASPAALAAAGRRVHGAAGTW
jgi:3-methyladenine DNA glycosylase/8-oxoguanine DNA glycosylase